MKRFLFILAFLQFNFSFSQETINPFIPEIVTEFPNVRDIAISPNGNEILFSAQSLMGNLSAIMVIKKENNLWSNPVVESFSGQFFDLEPFFSQDGLKLYFVSTRALNSKDLKPKDFDIWYVERNNISSNWSEPKNMGSPINTEHGEFYPSISNSGNLYFTRDNPSLNRKDDIYVSFLIDDMYSEPRVLSDAINSDGYEYNAFIAPDESYLIYGCYNKKGGFGSGDLYISFNSETGWTKALNLGNTINSNKMDYCPFVDSKTNTLYFTSKRDLTKIEHVSSLNTKDLLREFHKYENGSSRLYQVSIKAILEN